MLSIWTCVSFPSVRMRHGSISLCLVGGDGTDDRLDVSLTAHGAMEQKDVAKSGRKQVILQTHPSRSEPFRGRGQEKSHRYLGAG